jgi:DHA2 family multidrug resistance protein-like MFS transporter
MTSFLLIAVGGALLIVINAHDAGALILVIGAALLGFGGGSTMTITNKHIVSSVPKERTGTASAMIDVSSGIGFALSVAFFGSSGMLIFR